MKKTVSKNGKEYVLEISLTTGTDSDIYLCIKNGDLEPLILKSLNRSYVNAVLDIPVSEIKEEIERATEIIDVRNANLSELENWDGKL